MLTDLGQCELQKKSRKLTVKTPGPGIVPNIELVFRHSDSVYWTHELKTLLHI